MKLQTLDDIRSIDPGFTRLIDYWRSLVPEGSKAPGMAAFDPMAVYDIAPFLALVDVVAQKNSDHRYKWRFAGTGICRATGVEITGQWVDDFVTDPKSYAEVANSYNHVVANIEMDFWQRRIAIASEPQLQCFNAVSTHDYQRLSLPLLDGDGAQVGQLVSYYKFADSILQRAQGEPIDWIYADQGQT